MANRRCFSKDIVSSDNFYAMSPVAQALYFQLGMEADDDGIVDNTRGMMRVIGATEEDLQTLIDNKFLIPFKERNVYVIKHWLINNTVRKDRYSTSKYIDVLCQLEKKENGAYSLLDKPNEKPVNEVRKYEPTEAKKLRKKAEEESDLPYSFNHYIRSMFNSKECPICHCKMSMDNDFRKPTIQHNLPITLGGKHEISNISVICNSCNCSIGNREITEKLNNDLVVEYWNDYLAKNNKPLVATDIVATEDVKTQDRLDKSNLDKSKINKDKLSLVKDNECLSNKGESVLAQQYIAKLHELGVTDQDKVIVDYFNNDGDPMRVSNLITELKTNKELNINEFLESFWIYE